MCMRNMINSFAICGGRLGMMSNLNHTHRSTGESLLRHAAFLIIAAALAGCSGMPLRPDPPIISLAGLSPIEIGLFEQRYLVRLRIQNPNSYALPIARVSYKIEINDREFAHGVSRKGVTIPRQGEGVLELEVVSNLQALLAQLNSLMGAESPGLSYRLSGDISLVNRAFKIPFEREDTVYLGGEPGDGDSE